MKKLVIAYFSRHQRKIILFLQVDTGVVEQGDWHYSYFTLEVTYDQVLFTKFEHRKAHSS
jgi:hypothetical protein